MLKMTPICLLLALMMSVSAFAKTKVLIKTNKGDIKLDLFDDKAPVTVKNFIKYVNAKKYDGTIFHRVIDGFMIQGGGFTKDMKKVETFKPIQNEAHNGIGNDTGTIAMARTSDINSATNQFFINVNNNTMLNHTSKSPQGYGYAVFGKVVSGMSVVNKIKKISTGNKGMYQNVPTQDIIITKVELIKEKAKTSKKKK